MVVCSSWLPYGAFHKRRCCRYLLSSLLIALIYSMRHGSSAMSVQTGEHFRVLSRNQPIQLELALECHTEYILDPLSVLYRTVSAGQIWT